MKSSEGQVSGGGKIPNGRRAISASEDKTLQVWDLASGRIEATFSSEADVKACAVSFDGVTIVAGDGFGRMHFLTTVNVPSGPPLITAVRLWQFGDNCASGHWDKRLTAVCSWCGRRSPVRDTCSAGKSPARWTRAASRSNSTRLWWMGGADDFGTRNADCGTEMRD